MILDNVERPEIIEDLQVKNPETEIIYMTLNVSKKPDIEVCLKNIVDRIQFIDVLVNGAGIVADQNVELSIAVNLVSYF